MSKEENETSIPVPIKIPKIKTESETQTSGNLVLITPEKKTFEEMDSSQPQNMSIRKRRNLSKNRGQAARQREKTPEPGRTPIPYEDTTTSDDEDFGPQRSSREIEADSTYEEMRRLVSQQATVKDPVYDLNAEEVREARAFAANERRRRSISPFAIPDKEELSKLERKGSFIDPSNKLLSTTYTLSPKEDDLGRRNSLTIETPRERRASLSPPITASPVDKLGFTYPSPTTPKRQEEIKYPDEISKKNQEDRPKNKQATPAKKDTADFFTFDKVEEKTVRTVTKAQTPKLPEPDTGDLVTKVIQVERTPSKKLSQENRPNVEVRQRICRTPSRKSTADAKINIVKQPVKQVKEDVQSKVPPEKPARSKSATRFGGKTSESEMSEDQGQHRNTDAVAPPRRKVVPTPRRFLKNRSPRANRSQSVNRVEDLADKSAIVMSRTSKEIIELMEQARARSLSIPKDDPKLPKEYNNYNKKYSKTLMTPSKVPSTPKRSTRGVSCPKTIQIISDVEVLAGLNPIRKLDLEFEKRKRNSTSSYVDASQSEYTSSCYSSSPSENEYPFDLAEKTAELTQKLHILSQQVDKNITNILLSNDNIESKKSTVRKRNSSKSAEINDKNGINKVVKEPKEVLTESKTEDKICEKQIKRKWKLFKIGENYRLFVKEHQDKYNSIKSLTSRCICDILLLIIFCGLGGMMFKTLEGSFENSFKCTTRSVKRDFIESLWRGSNYMREEEWKSLARKKLFEFEDQLHNAHEAGVTSYSGQRSWNFMNSFVYCLTLITTIGYGHIAPTTTSGRVATILYAIIGIPLFLIVLADFGKLFTRIIKFFWSFIRRFYYTRSCRKVRRTVPVQEIMKGMNIVYDAVRRPSQIMFEDDEGAEKTEDGTQKSPPLQRKPSADVPPPLPPKPGSLFIKDLDAETEPDTPAPSLYEIDDEFNLPISVAIVILIVYIIIGAVVYHLWESWDFFESFYFVFISMSTIGLGDLVPDHPMFMMASILYLVFGLALTSMCINVVQEKLSDTFKQASAKLGATIGLKVADEDGSLVPITPPPTEIVPVHKSKRTEAGDDNDDETKNTEENEGASKSKVKWEG